MPSGLTMVSDKLRGRAPEIFRGGYLIVLCGCKCLIIGQMLWAYCKEVGLLREVGHMLNSAKKLRFLFILRGNSFILRGLAPRVAGFHPRWGS